MKLSCNWIALACASTPLAAHLMAAQLSGVVLDPQGTAVPQAVVDLLSPRGRIERSVRADARGAFLLTDVARGSYELTVAAPGFATLREAVRVASPASAIELQLRLQLAPFLDSVTVTTAPGTVEDVGETPQPVNVVSASALQERRASVLPELLREETGLHVQQTSPHQGSIFVRGLTGQHVVTLVDGVRFNNATFRPGPNQYQALIDPSSLERIEVVRGPSSVQYGSDSLGGAVNVLTRRDAHSGGQMSMYAGSSDLSGGMDVAASFRGLTLASFGKRINDLRAGGRRDSHAAATRFLGLAAPGRLQDTAFTGFGWSARASIKSLSFFYMRTEQHGGRRYDQLNGGNGNLRAGFDPQTLDFFYSRYEKTALGPLDSISGTLSFNRIRDDRQTQSGDPASPIVYDFARTDARGYQVQGTGHVGSRNLFGFGAELFDENVRSRLYRLNAVSGIISGSLRPRFPDGATYRTYAGWLQDTVELVPHRVRATAGLRYAAFRHADRIGGHLETGDVTYHVGSSYFVSSTLALHGVVSRGFRAPNISDMSQIGLTSSGFEVSPGEAARLGALVRALRPESLLNYEGGTRFSNGRVSAGLSYFFSDLRDLISKRTLVLPSGAVGQTIGGEPIMFQDPAEGWVRVAVDPRPVATRVNMAEIQMSGVELWQRLRLGSRWTLQANFFRMRGRDPSGAPPEIESGIPPASGYVSLRFHPSSRWWLEAASNLAWRQDRLSSLELADQRVGAVRTRASVANFFGNGARARGLVVDGRLVATGETLDEVQDRVLGPGVAAAPLFRSTRGYAIFHLRAGFQVTERSTLGVLLDNLLDHNYRTHGSGVDGPGMHLQLRYTIRF